MIVAGMRQSLLVMEESPHHSAATALSSFDLQAPVDRASSSSTGRRLPTVLGCPARNATDDVGLEMLRQLLNADCCILEVTSVDSLVSELVARIAEDHPIAICIASLPPGGMSHARYLSKRLREASPDIQIIVGRWGPNSVSKLDRELLISAGANSVTTSLLETRKLLESWVLVSISEPLTSIAS